MYFEIFSNRKAHEGVCTFKTKFKTCPKGFGLKVAKLRLKILLKMKDNLIGTTDSLAVVSGNCQSQADQSLGEV